MLREVENGFHKILRLRKEEGSEISITCFYEELRVIGFGEIVPLHSAEIKGYSCYGIHANHMDMTKFPNREDRGYDAILGELQRWKGSAHRARDNKSHSAVHDVKHCREKTSMEMGVKLGDDKGLTPRTMVEQGSNQFGDIRAWNRQVNQGDFYNTGFSPQATVSPETTGQYSYNTFYALDGYKRVPSTYYASNAIQQLHATDTDHKMAKLWMVPRTASRLYTGREELGERLAQVLSFNPSTPSTQQRIFTITGVGGTGKSEVCLKFAEDHRDEYWGVFWLNAGSIATAEQGYMDLGRRCGVAEPSLENVKSWLACTSQRWLLIIDNADDPEIDYSEYIPSGKRGDILLTTRNPECCIYNTAGSEPLGDLEPKLARKLLLRASSIIESRWKEKEKAAMAVVNILGSHTLAIIQAGAFVRQKLCTLEEYPTIFQQQRGQLLKFYSKQKPSVYDNVYTTFEVSAEYLQKSRLPESLDALNLLHTLAFMHNNGISEKIFQRASEYASELKDSGINNDEEVLALSMHHITRLPSYAQQEWSSLQDLLRWRKACSVLESLSIITPGNDDSAAISVHPLVHIWAKERQDHQSRYRAWQSAATILALSCQGWYSYHPFFSFLQPHVRACVSHNINEYTQHMSDMEAAQILFQLAYVLDIMRDESSLTFLVQCIRLRLQDGFGAKEETTLQIKDFTGRVYLQQGKFQEVVDIFKEVAEGRSRMMAEDHPSRLASQHALAGAYEANGQVDEAVTLLEHVVKVQEKLAEDHPSRLASQHALAGAYRANGQVDEAVTLLEHVVKVQEKLAEDHPSRLASQHALAGAYEANGQVDEAVTLLEHVVKVQEKLAEDHPSRLASQHALASAYEANGQVDEAVTLLEHVVKVEEKLAEDHPSRLASQHALASAYEANGQGDEAVTLLEHVVKVEEKLAEDHPSRLASQHALAGAYEANGQVDEAVTLLEHVVKVQEKLAEDHPSRLASQHALAGAYRANGQVDEAVTLLEHVVKVQEKLAEDHPSRLASQHALAGAYEANGQVDEAVTLLEHVVKVRGKLAEDHPSRLASQHALASAYEANGQVDEAVTLLEHVVKVQEKLAEDHPSRLASQHALAGAYRANGQVDEAVTLLEHVVEVQKQLAEENPARLASQHALAGAYRANGQVDEAVTLLEHVVKVEEKLAEDHPSRLAPQHALAGAYEANGQVDEAVTLLEHVVKVQEKLAEDHPSRLASQHALASAYEANGQVDEAVTLLEHVVKVQEKAS
ncbi:hypothetical protein N7G274_002425 [Stereocaulon virgatum]|uniref:TPR-like protein n=1 Tax=Stereocaulon virgatum TaxID=373712 RepID=A0ABR4AGL4_9LECA